MMKMISHLERVYLTSELNLIMLILLSECLTKFKDLKTVFHFYRIKGIKKNQQSDYYRSYARRDSIRRCKRDYYFRSKSGSEEWFRYRLGLCRRQTGSY